MSDGLPDDVAKAPRYVQLVLPSLFLPTRHRKPGSKNRYDSRVVWMDLWVESKSIQSCIFRPRSLFVEGPLTFPSWRVDA